MKNSADFLLASKVDLEKSKLKVNRLTDNLINQIYSDAALAQGIHPVNSFDQLVHEMKTVKQFKTGDEELDKLLQDEGISSDEIIEVCGTSGSGKTYFCLKMACLAIIENK